MFDISLPPLFPYFMQALLVLSLFFVRSPNVITLFIALDIVIACIAGLIVPIGVIFLIIFWGLCEYHWRKPASRQWVRHVRFMLVIVGALGFANHLIPGFHNLKVFDAMQFSSLSAPFSMYLNIDKTLVAVILVSSSRILFKQNTNMNALDVIKIAALCMFTLIPLAVWSGYVAFDPKWPHGAWLWILNNLLFVCFAEEVIFRGMIQAHMADFLRRWNTPAFVSMGMAAVLFATLLLGHLHGGLGYLAFVMIAGLFYGYAYHKTQRVEAAIGVHFLLNLCHFVLFTYPSTSL